MYDMKSRRVVTNHEVFFSSSPVQSGVRWCTCGHKIVHISATFFLCFFFFPQIQQFVHGIPRARFVECSLRNGYGLRELKTFLNIPFLDLKRRMILQEAARVQHEAELALEEVDLLLYEQNMDRFVPQLASPLLVGGESSDCVCARDCSF